MFDNLKIGKKMLLLSGTILCLLLVVLVVGMYGLSNTVKDGQRVSNGEQLRADMAKLEIAYLDWTGHIATFLTDDDSNELDVQVQSGFDKWYTGEGRQKAEQLLPNLRSNLQAIEQPYVALHASVNKIKAAYHAADPSLPQFLTEKELDHMSWAYKIQQAILDKDREVNVEFDHTKCSLGQFLYGEEGRKAIAIDPDLRPILQAIKEPHERLHRQGEKINAFLKAGKFVEAADYFATEVSPTLKEVSSLLIKAKQTTAEALKGQQKARMIFNTETKSALHEVQKQFTEMREKISTHAEGLIKETAADIKNQTVIVISVGIIALILGSLLALLISRSLTGPMRKAVDMLEEMEKGHLGERLKLNRSDEIGQMTKSLDEVADFFQYELLAMTKKMSDGDLTFEISPRDDQDLVRGSLQKLGVDLNDIMGQIQIAGNEISSASGEIADSSQSLSQGATESAASLEEISASLNQTSSQTTLNAENAVQANSLSTETRQAAEKGSAQMQEMVAAMTEINEEGQKISKIIKTIDEIAFQTNLLALNAAVEAARAGQHGKGFAVVAEEVRNLAARSAKAATETSELIEGSVEKTSNGMVIANQTAKALDEIFSGVSKVTDLVAEISAASNEQAQGISEINTGITQIDTVTQQNTASAEESAAAAEELSAQAAQLRSMLQRFKLKKGQSIASPVVQKDSFSAAIPQTDSGGWGGIEEKQNTAITQPQITLDDSDFGKY